MGSTLTRGRAEAAGLPMTVSGQPSSTIQLSVVGKAVAEKGESGLLWDGGVEWAE